MVQDELRKQTLEAMNLFLLAEKYWANELANKAIDKVQDMHSRRGCTFNAKFMKRIFEITHKYSKFRMYSVATVCWLLSLPVKDENQISGYLELFPGIPGLGADFAKFQRKFGARLYGKSGAKLFDPRIRSEEGLGLCYSHTHAEGKVCHLKKAK